MRIGLFGGTFNPPHTGHRLVAEQACETLALDRLIWIPAARSPFKDGARDVAPHHRLAMTTLAASDHACFSVSDVELRRDPPSYTVDTVREYAGVFPGAELMLLMGQDSWHDFERWKEPSVIRTLAAVAVYPRPGSSGSAQGADHALEAPRMDVSSSELRERLARGISVAGLIRPSVLDYIRKHGLYSV